MKSTWLQWTIENKYKFERVQLSDAEVMEFSGAVKEFMDMEHDPATDKDVYSLGHLSPFLPLSSPLSSPLSILHTHTRTHLSSLSAVRYTCQA